MRAFFWFALAMHQLADDGEDLGDQPRISVWSCSITNERPLRSSSILPRARW